MPPVFLGLAGHPVRWRLLGELARSDRQVHELTALVGQPQNLVSYHLGRLRQANLVTARRSTADGRDTYYSLDLALCGRLLAAAGGALHPALLLAPPAVSVPASETGTGSGVVPVYRQQLPLADGRGAAAAGGRRRRPRCVVRAATPSRCTGTPSR